MKDKCNFCKKCSNCNTEKDISNFYKRGKGEKGYRSQCKECMYILKHYGKDSFKESRSKFRENKLKTSKEAWRRRKYHSKDKAIDTRLKHKYGITLEIYNEMIKLQDNKCKICTNTLTKANIDHCHNTGRVRGLLCRECNLGLGLFKDNPFTMQEAAKYIINNTKTNCYACDNYCGNIECVWNPFTKEEE